ncbi:hypothetical protein TNIN_220051 [Trichonephila inaurata madagascariensis]|uniref:Uncharacterized protein n=1 Tax=Trichonephila inaurata madagascariensis TaxID=2747483 RepID=A0A8X6WVH8_9ARAC|nr:hypothetical protein TNIN_220051 [Trichonephila inaurata madagascariensis]
MPVHNFPKAVLEKKILDFSARDEEDVSHALEIVQDSPNKSWRLPGNQSLPLFLYSQELVLTSPPFFIRSFSEEETAILSVICVFVCPSNEGGLSGKSLGDLTSAFFIAFFKRFVVAEVKTLRDLLRSRETQILMELAEISEKSSPS